MNNFSLRLITGILLVIILFFASWLSIYSFFGVFLLIVVFGVWELYTLSEKHLNVKTSYTWGIIMAATLFCASFIFELTDSPILYILVQIQAIIYFIRELYRNNKKAMNNLAHTFFALIYFALPLSFLNLMLADNGNFNTNIILVILVLVWIFDIFSYIIGSLIGKHKLFERISPNKSWEGVVGSGILTLVSAFYISIYFPILNTLNTIVIGIIIVILGTFGDLTASLIKRSAKVKDSGSILPGHGGIIDRFDTMVLSVPGIFTYLKIVEVI